MSITKETNYILSVVAIVTLLAPVPFRPKTIPIYNLKSETKGPTWNRHSSHIVVAPIDRLCGVDGSWSRQILGISVFIKTAPVAKLLSRNSITGVILFLL